VRLRNASTGEGERVRICAGLNQLDRHLRLLGLERSDERLGGVKLVVAAVEPATRVVGGGVLRKDLDGLGPRIEADVRRRTVLEELDDGDHIRVVDGRGDEGEGARSPVVTTKGDMVD